MRGSHIDGNESVLFTINRDDLALLVMPAIDSISKFVGRLFRRFPDSLVAEVIESGIHLTGGGSTLDLLVHRIEEATGLRATRNHDPLRSVVNGAREMLREEANVRRILTA